MRKPNIGMNLRRQSMEEYGLPEKYGDGRRTARRGSNNYTRMVTPSDQVRRLRRVLDVLVALASVLEDRSRIVDGRVQLDLAALGPALKRQLNERGFRGGRDALAELFRCSDDRPLEITSTHWDGQRCYVLVLGEGPLRRALEEATEAALDHWSGREAAATGPCAAAGECMLTAVGCMSCTASDAWTA